MKDLPCLIGKTFGRLKVLSQEGTNNKGSRLWKCLCECGNTAIITSYNLNSSHTKSCGCLGKELLSNRSKDQADIFRESLIGKVYNRLTVVKVSHIGIDNSTYLICQCDCGNTTTVRLNALTSNNTASCGCYKKERIAEGTIKHNLSDHPLYNVWAHMKSRCYNHNVPEFKDYGGRGIIICQEWLGDFKEFYDWSIRNGYRSGLTIDRYPNNDGNYEPGNCRWATMSEQNQNRRSTKLNKENVLAIRTDNRSNEEIAKEYNIDKSHVSGIKTNKTWRDL